MTDKILTEAFDKMKAIEESDDPFCIAEESIDEAVGEFDQQKLVYKAMNHYYDQLDKFHGRLKRGSLAQTMESLGYTGERAALEQKVADILEEFGDFMPGLDMAINGEPNYGESNNG